MGILVVDDDVLIRDILGDWLDILGHSTLKAKDGLDGILFFNKQKPDLVITDFQMPQVNGATLTHHVKSQAPYIPMIMTTGHSERFSKVEAEQIGANEYLAKPLILERLQEIIDTYARCLANDPIPAL